MSWEDWYLPHVCGLEVSLALSKGHKFTCNTSKAHWLTCCMLFISSIHKQKATMCGRAQRLCAGVLLSVLGRSDASSSNTFASFSKLHNVSRSELVFPLSSGVVWPSASSLYFILSWRKRKSSAMTALHPAVCCSASDTCIPQTSEPNSVWLVAGG